MRVIECPPQSLWDRVVSRSDWSTFFHTFTWAQIVIGTFPDYRVATKAFVLDDGAVAIVPMVASYERNRYFRWCESMYPGGYGGAVAERTLTRDEIDSIFRRLTDRRTAYLHVMGNPFDHHDFPPGFERSEEHTHVLDLTPGFDAIYASYRDGHKYSVKRARKLGVQVEIAATEADYRAYYESYLDNLKRWGDRTLVTYPYSLFKEIWRSRSENTKLWIAKVGEEVASGCLVFYHNRHVLYWHAATSERFFNHGAGPLLTTEILRDACQRGFAYYDFSPSGRLEGVERYKEGFGAKKLAFYSYIWQKNRLHEAYQRLRQALSRGSSGRGSGEAAPEEVDKVGLSPGT
jgi:hypothetical protein